MGNVGPVGPTASQPWDLGTEGVAFWPAQVSPFNGAAFSLLSIIFGFFSKGGHWSKFSLKKISFS